MSTNKRRHDEKGASRQSKQPPAKQNVVAHVQQPNLDSDQLTTTSVLQLQSAIGNHAVQRLLHADRQAGTVGQIARVVQQGTQTSVIQRYELEGPFNKNDPVHEVLTLMAIKKALAQVKSDGGKAGSLLKGVDTSSFPKSADKEGHNIAPEKIDKSAQQFIRGVIWPDDPQGYLFDSDEGTENYSSGLMWYEEFDADEKDEPEELIARSHFGDLQFFHAMATADKEDPVATKKKIMSWSRFLTDVSTGRISHKEKLKDIELTKKLFPSHQHYTVAKLFNFEKGSAQQIQQRAAGALMHLIQDAQAEGHLGRDKKGDVKQFRSYEHQDHGKHGDKDAWAKGKTLGDRINNTPGAKNAIDKCAQVLVLLDQGASTDAVIKFLDSEVFKLSADAEKSGPGKDFKK